MNAKDGMKELERRIQLYIQRTLQDIRVEAADEFDRNFEREAFFNQKWQRRKWRDDESRGLLVQTGALRRSINLGQTPRFAQIQGNRITFQSDLPYARIHNEGGEIKVTRKMQKYFWYRYLTITGNRKGSFSSQLQRKKNGSLRNNKRNRRLSDEAEFYRAMALKRVGSSIIIPSRRFVGDHPKLQELIREIAIANTHYITD